MKVCFFGLGSIGKRHLKNLYTIVSRKNINLHIHAFRKVSKPLEKELNGLIEKVIYMEDELDDDYDIAFITNPTSLHYDTIKLIQSKTKHMFIEKPIVDNKKYDFCSLRLHESGVYYVAGPLRFTGVIQNLKNIIKKENIYCVRVICSSYLPDWRPGTDYRTVYSAKKDQGGGVCIDLIHEWDYITYLFGFPEEVKCIFGKYSHLEIDSEDIAIYIARYKDKLVELHLDYFGIMPRRSIELFTNNGVITGDLLNETINFTDNRSIIKLSNDKNSMYLKELEFFIDNITQNKYFNNINHSIRVLALTKGEMY